MNPGVETTAPGAGGGGRLDHGWRIVAALAVTQTIGYGVLYYAFSVFLMPMSRDLRATGTQIAAALTLAVLTTALCAPRAGRWLDALVVRRSRMPAAKPGRRADLVREAVRARPFWFLVAAFTAHGGGVAVIGVLLVTYLIHLGHAPVFAATVAGLLGVLSVTGRVVTTGLRRRWAAAPVAAAVFAVQGLGALLLPVVGESAAGAIGCVLLFGIGFGVGTITLPYLLAERYGSAAYASLSGRIAMFSGIRPGRLPSPTIRHPSNKRCLR
ncbi:MFS transporter [Nonomuraea sp. C10]|uniref:MFS transporter n=1 Tax=Nonomuraea sp. C10 TaxID=2600577 RepID=UPI0021C2AF31|nr:MFS transporter [Nonomuraea sp. C10]